MKSRCSLSLDLDNQWSYMKTHGDAGWQSFPSYLDVVVPRVLDVLAESGTRITFFVVGQDAALPKNGRALRSIVQAGHEIGNHSFHHEPWLHLYARPRIEIEIAAAEEHIQAATGVKPRGFRGPGFSLSHDVLRVLTERGYEYDASTFPTFIGPLARWYYFRSAKLSLAEQQERALLFGKFNEGFRPLKPYMWTVAGSQLLEIPVTTMPLFRVPIHISYLIYLLSYSEALALGYFRASLHLCRAAGIEPSILLHPLDFLGSDDVASLCFFPGMNLPGKRKTAFVRRLITLLDGMFELCSMSEHAGHLWSNRERLVERGVDGEVPQAAAASH